VSPETYRDVAEAAWRWVLDLVRWDAGPWVPGTVTIPESAGPAAPRVLGQRRSLLRYGGRE
jgi:hypothetical protein